MRGRSIYCVALLGLVSGCQSGGRSEPSPREPRVAEKLILRPPVASNDPVHGGQPIGKLVPGTYADTSSDSAMGVHFERQEPRRARGATLSDLASKVRFAGFEHPAGPADKDVPVVAFAAPIGIEGEGVDRFDSDEPSVATLSEGVSLASFESMALATHPQVSEARALVGVARGQYTQAGLPYNPTLQYQSTEIGNAGASGMHAVNLNQRFVTANKLGLAQQVRAHEVQQQIAQLRRAELTVLTGVRIAFTRTLLAQQRVELSSQIVQLAEKSVESVATLLEAQEVSRIELLQAQVEADRARVALENAQTELQAFRRALAAAVGAGPLPEGPLLGDVVDDLQETPWESMLEQVASASPELAGAGSRLERARWSLCLARAQVTPDITGQLGAGVDTATDDAYATIGVTLPLPLRNRNEGQIRSARAEIAAASAAIENTMLSLESRLADAARRYRVSRQTFFRFRDSVLPNALETFELTKSAFDAGEANYVQLLTAQRTLFTTQLSMLDAAVEAREATAEIEGQLVTLQVPNANR